jgi:hypothetical protein
MNASHLESIITSSRRCRQQQQHCQPVHSTGLLSLPGWRMLPADLAAAQLSLVHWYWCRCWSPVVRPGSPSALRLVQEISQATHCSRWVHTQQLPLVVPTQAPSCWVAPSQLLYCIILLTSMAWVPTWCDPASHVHTVSCCRPLMEPSGAWLCRM